VTAHRTGLASSGAPTGRGHDPERFSHVVQTADRSRGDQGSRQVGQTAAGSGSSQTGRELRVQPDTEDARSRFRPASGTSPMSNDSVRRAPGFRRPTPLRPDTSPRAASPGTNSQSPPQFTHADPHSFPTPHACPKRRCVLPRACPDAPAQRHDRRHHSKAVRRSQHDRSEAGVSSGRFFFARQGPETVGMMRGLLQNEAAFL